jgi:Tol biopolymer transport system component
MRSLLPFALAGVFLTGGVAAAEPQGPPPPGVIVYARQIDGRGVLVVGRPGGSEAVRITDGPLDTNPRWSPDGRRVVFERSVAEDVGSVWVVNVDGTGERELDPDPYAEHPRFSPDGRWIAYQVQTSESIPDGTRAHTTFELWLVRPDGSGRRLLRRSGEGELGEESARYYVRSGAWAWSPDSRRIAFVRPRSDADPERGGIHVVDVETGATRYLGRGVDADWSPDGRRLAVTTNDQGILGDPECGTVWIVTVDGGERRRLVRPSRASCNLFPRWSPDGRTVVFARSDGARRVLVAASSDGSRLQPLARLRPAAHAWPADCTTLFEYVSPHDAGWVVRDGRSRLRFVPAPGPRGDWRCTTTPPVRASTLSGATQ